MRESFTFAKKTLMIVFPNAKINIGLNITQKRPDGYHNLETLFYPLQLTDILEIIPDSTIDKMELRIDGISLDHEQGENLVEKAWKILHDYHAIDGCRAMLQKIIPFGAGLGGGSADAAFTLKALNDLFELNLTSEQLKMYAAQIGADCPFFIDNTPSLATGIGEILEPASIQLNGYTLVLVKPDFGVPTKDAYAGITPAIPEISLHEITHETPENWKNFVKNDFEKSVFRKYPAVEAIKEKLYQEGAVYAAMSGSGSSVFGIFDHAPSTTDWFPPSYFVWTENL